MDLASSSLTLFAKVVAVDSCASPLPSGQEGRFCLGMDCLIGPPLRTLGDSNWYSRWPHPSPHPLAVKLQVSDG